MKIVFMGTPDFSVGTLQALIDAGHTITLVVTQPDKPKGRGKEMQITPVKECAAANGIPVFQPVKIKTAESVAELSKYEADLFVVVAFGQILSKEILEMPKYGCVNVHASLLPKYRGAAPIQWAIINGEKETGVTIMQMDDGIDTGDMLMRTVVPIAWDETGASLHDKLAKAGAKLMVEAAECIEKGEIHPRKQDDSKKTYARMLTKDFGKIDFRKPADEIERLVRGLNSWPSAYTRLHGKTLKVWASYTIDCDEGVPGEITEVTKDAIIVRCGQWSLAITELQLEGKKRMKTEAFLLGYHVKAGDMLM